MSPRVTGDPASTAAVPLGPVDPTSAPGVLRRAWRAWKRFGKRLADIQARILLTVFYYVIAAPFGIVMRFTDPLGLRPGIRHGWRARPPLAGSAMDRARRQF
ncbi:MAG: hypothetical protein HY294_04415 [Candidatus Rokubacteria bacterium]|nr:hypothetical protein [Candidatus Rokubacteria bacterium]